MATIIDALVVQLGLDSSAFQTGQRQVAGSLKATEDAATRTAKSMQASGTQAAEMFSRIKVEALSLLSIFLGGKTIESFVRDTTRSLADLSRQAFNIGVSAQDIQAFGLAVERMGGNADAARNSLEGLAKARQQWSTFGNNPEFIQGLAPIHATPQMSPLEIMERFSDFVRATENQPGGAQRIQQIGGLLGIDQGTINSLIQMNQTTTLAAEMRKSAELGDVASKQQIEAATKFQTSVASFEQAIEGLARALIPFEGLSVIIDQLTRDFTTKQPGIGDVNPDLTRDATGALNWLDNLVPGWLSDFIQHGNTPSGDVSGSGGPAVTPGPGPRANPNDPRGIRNNNPLNLEYAPGQGTSTSDGRFGIYPTMEGGVAAAARQIQIYRDRYGLNTIAGIVGRWAPGSENDTLAYIASVSKAMGVGPNVPLNLNDPAVMSALIAAMAQVENGRALDPGVVRRGVAGGLSPNGVPRTGPAFGQQTLPDPALAPGRLAGPRATQQSATVANNDNSATVGTIVINVPNGDPKTIAAGISRALADQHTQQINAQSNRGLM